MMKLEVAILLQRSLLNINLQQGGRKCAGVSTLQGFL